MTDQHCLPSQSVHTEHISSHPLLGKIHYNKDADLATYLLNPEILDVKEGFIEAPMTPGLGLEMNEELIREASKTSVHWSNPVWRGEDGSFREW